MQLPLISLLLHQFVLALMLHLPLIAHTRQRFITISIQYITIRKLIRSKHWTTFRKIQTLTHWCESHINLHSLIPWASTCSTTYTKIAKILQRLSIILHRSGVHQLKIRRILRRSTTMNTRPHITICGIRTLPHKFLKIWWLMLSWHLNSEAHIAHFLSQNWWPSFISISTPSSHLHHPIPSLELLLTEMARILYVHIIIRGLVLASLISFRKSNSPLFLCTWLLLDLWASNLLVDLMLKHILPLCQLIITVTRKVLLPKAKICWARLRPQMLKLRARMWRPSNLALRLEARIIGLRMHDKLRIEVLVYILIRSIRTRQR